MAKTKISQYDATAANNTDIDSINIAEGMAPSNVNNAIRELMAHLKDMDAGTQALTSPQLTSADINGGTIDGVTIGGASAGAGTFTNLTATGTTTLAGASTSADITFGDNDKAIFGAGSDLQIYHDGSNSYIDETGTGTLRIRGYNQVRITDTSDNIAAIFKGDAESTLYHNNSPKLATTATGIDVTGTVTADGLTVDGNGSLLTLDNGSNPATLSNTNGNVTFDFDTTNAGRNYIIQGNNLNVFSASNGGDISFYDSLGSSQSFFWDASAESLGIGTSSPSNLLDIQSSTASGGMLELNNTGDTSRMLFISNSDGMIIRSNNSASGAVAKDTIFQQGTVEAMRIDSSGNVGIGIDSPQEQLHIHGDASATRLRISGGGLNNTYGGFVEGEGVTGSGGRLRLGVVDNSTDRVGIEILAQLNSIVFNTGSSTTEAMRIDSSGRLLHGKTTSGDYVTGTEIQPAGAILSYRAGGVAAIHGRTDDGEIIRLTSNSSIVGSIGARSGDLGVATGNTGIRFYDASRSILPYDPTVPNEPANVISLGDSGSTFKDLYLSGGVYLGGTGAANKLDDYEFGTFTPTIEGDSTAGTTGYSSQIGRYVKIGDLVHFQIKVQWTSQTGSGGIRVGNLPFTQFFNGTSGSGTPVSVYAVGCSDLTFTGTQIYGFAVSNTNKIGLAQFSSAVGSSTIPMDTAAIIEITGSYYTTA